ncbi:hypothetical protein E1742_04600 [Pseudoduganella plicata]|uniref:Uncharacterized protein n=1 Tax=Pseudoduganella plicata TaxID=321984 RepID=A0ABX5S5X8_9BURK|nr:hypothetical protein E1742_04600 [Pseudoduganella plicata]
MLLLIALSLGIARLIGGVPDLSGPDKWISPASSLCLPAAEIPANTLVTLDTAPLATPAPAGAAGRGAPAFMLDVVASADTALQFKSLNGTTDNAQVAIGGNALRVTGTTAGLQFRARGGDPRLLVVHAGKQYTLQRAATFTAPPDAAYDIRIAAGVMAQYKDGKYLVAPGTVLASVALDASMAFTTTQPLSTQRFVPYLPATLVGSQATGKSGLTTFSFAASQWSAPPDATRDGFVACALSANNVWRRLPASTGSDGAATVTLERDKVPEHALHHDVELILLGADGTPLGRGGIRLYHRLFAAAISVVLTLAFLWLITRARAQQRGSTDGDGMLTGLIIGADGEASLSLFQIFFWTVLTVWACFYVFVVAGDLIKLTEDIMGLLGIAGAGSVLARWAAVTATPAAPSPAGATTSPFWSMLDTKGRFDLLKLQLFVFTLLIGLFVICRIADTAAFPDLDDNTLLLLGVSQSVYIFGKFAANSDSPRHTDLLAARTELDLLEAGKSRQTAKKTELETQAAAEADAQKKQLLADRIAAVDRALADLDTRLLAARERYNTLLDGARV